MILIKVHTENGIENHRVEDFPCKVGRALDNDVIINDASVSAHHAVIDRDAEGFYVEDLGSTNGLRVRNKLHSRIQIKKSVEIRFGEVSADIRSSTEVSAHTVNLRDVRSRATQKIPAGARALAWTLFAILGTFLYRRFMLPAFKSSEFAKDELTATLVVLVIAAAIAFWSKVQNKSYNYFEFVSVLMKTSVMVLIYFAFADFIKFNVGVDWFGTALELCAMIGISFFMAYGFSNFLFPRAASKLRAVSVLSLILGIYAVTFALREFRDQRFDNAEFASSVSYPVVSFSTSKNDFEKFEVHLNELESDIEKQRSELIKKNAAEM